jgi:hypothetical protein
MELLAEPGHRRLQAHRPAAGAELRPAARGRGAPAPPAAVFRGTDTRSLYRAVDEHGQVGDVLFREHRATASATAFLRQALARTGGRPTRVIRDHRQPYLTAVQAALPEAAPARTGGAAPAGGPPHPAGAAPAPPATGAGRRGRRRACLPAAAVTPRATGRSTQQRRELREGDPFGDPLPPSAVAVEQDDGGPLGALQVQHQLERRHAEGGQLGRGGAAQQLGGQILHAGDVPGERLHGGKRDGAAARWGARRCP